MPQSFMNIPAKVNVQAFNLQIMAIVGDAKRVQAAITVKATGPAGAVQISSFQYTVDGGVSYHNCTFSNPPANMEIPATPGGTLTTLTWDVYTDLGYDALNRSIPIRAVITDGVHFSPTAQGTVVIQKQYKEKIDPTRNGIKSNTAVGMFISIKGKR